MKKSITTLAVLASTSLISSMHADVFVLKDGTKLEADIISEKSDSYVLSVEVVKGIRDERTVKKSDISDIIQSDPSIQDFEELKKLTPTPDLVEADDYQRVLDNIVNPFIEKYPKSKLLPKAQEIKAELETEMKAIAEGGIKMNGKIISPAERQMDLYNIDASIKYEQMNRLAKSRAFSSAMREFETLEKQYRHTKAFEKALDLAASMLPAYKAQLEQMISNADDAVKQRDIALERMDHSDRLRTERMFAAEEDKYQKAMAEAKASETRWIPVNRYHKKEMESARRVLVREIGRISELRSEETKDAGAAFHAVMTHLDKNELELAKDSFKDFKRARPPKDYQLILVEKLKSAEETMRQLEEEKRREAEEEARKAEEEARKAAEEAAKAAEKGGKKEGKGKDKK
ncbi:hypothetical protein SAMN02745181_3112 [Rubritalea squalenifaciens DSM 18772]|uniref:DUF5667 domain-containing protein n=2 Tax=Rubritalea TaxID=361050 RepID=A0A1M6P999_9BACT|nr:PTPDL family protein [Rubritalea squalenifaciens]SHK04452.1 hypothetical protein SAMN02745181_3112 [Rubritalea squalenifaciens DSM 18772]